MSGLNKYRNELKGNLFGKERVLRANHEALLLMEQNAGKGLYQLAMTSGFMGYRETVAIIHAGLVGGGEMGITDNTKPIKFSEVGDLVVEYGFATANNAAQKFLLIAFKGPHKLDEDKKKEDPKEKALAE